MTTSLAVRERERERERERVIARIRGSQPGPLLAVVGSIHGNEPAGVAALERVTRELLQAGESETGGGLTRGDVLALTGNLGALEARKRFIEEDLNRHWSAQRLSEEPASVEDRERAALFETLASGFVEARGSVVLLDLHTTSGQGTVFAVFADTLRSRHFARRFPVPAVLGLEEALEGTLVDYVGLLGHVAMGVEGGQHDDSTSVDNLAAAIWLALAELDMLPAARRALVRAERRRLTRATEGTPRIVEVIYRHGLEGRTGFRMEPGYRSFQRVEEGQVIASESTGPVASPASGFLLMPLYQKLGDDGFFVVRRVLAFWLWLSAALRYLRLGRFAHWLPGVSRRPGERLVLDVDRRIARWYSLEVLRLLGFRRRHDDGKVLVVEKRQNDLP